MSHILEATKTNVREAALVAVGMPVVLFDRVSGRVNARLHLDTYVGLAREHAERALDGYEAKVKEVVGGVAKIVPARSTSAPLSAPVVADSPPAPARKAPARKAAAKATGKKAVRPGPAARR